MVILLRAILTIWAYLWVVAATLFCGVFYLAGAPFDRRALWMDFWQDTYSRMILFGIGVPLSVEGTENVPRGQACVVMPNHRSYLDIPAVVLSVRGLSIRFVAKRELKRIPILGWAVASSQHIKVNRGNREQAVAALREATTKIRRGIALAIFPEGTRSSSDRLLPFKRGGFYVAVDSGFPILPISIRNAGTIYGKMQLLFQPGNIHVVIHPPVSVEGRTRSDIDALVLEVRRAMLSGLPASAAVEGIEKRAPAKEEHA
jgi:1-acyl-sn-glycerol-3-phosphate acyltransferase